jgi:hypothetical protein
MEKDLHCRLITSWVKVQYNPRTRRWIPCLAQKPLEIELDVVSFTRPHDLLEAMGTPFHEARPIFHSYRVDRAACSELSRVSKHRQNCTSRALAGVKAQTKPVKSERAVALSLEATSQLCRAM